MSLVVVNSLIPLDWQKYKVICLQSDDWGLCGWVPNRDVYEKLTNDGLPQKVVKKLELLGSTLESPDDMENIFVILKRYRGGDGRYPIFQAAYVMSNPDYEAIEKGGFRAYKELVIPQVPSLWERGDFVAEAKQGIKEGVWYPSYHGNSHFNPIRWMELLKNGHRSVRETFKFQSFIHDEIESQKEVNSEFSEKLSYKQQKKLIELGIQRFREVFGYPPRSAIAPNYVWQMKTEKALSENGIRVIQGKNYQILRRRFFDKVRGKVINLMGKKSADKIWQIRMGDYNPCLEVTYLIRNVDFEPRGNSEPNNPFGAEGAYQKILDAWSNNEPAVISTHRINYVYLDERWVEENLRQLDELLSKIQTNHPEAVYLTDWEVAQLYRNGTSIIQLGEVIVCRNYTSSKRTFKVEVPQGYRVKDVQNLRSKECLNFTLKGNVLTFTADEGDYQVNLQKE